jgi:hypothetical protein
MFFGAATITPKNQNLKPFELVGTWLYKPEYDCWYCAGNSFPAKIVSDFREMNQK